MKYCTHNFQTNERKMNTFNVVNYSLEIKLWQSDFAFAIVKTKSKVHDIYHNLHMENIYNSHIFL